jgi:hypothetical protein
MALYRNIAGFLNNEQIGLSLYNTPSLTLLTPESSILPSPFTDPAASQQQRQTIQDTYAAEMTAAYDYLLTTSLPDLTTAGYYVSENGSVFKWQDDGRTTSIAYLPLDWIQHVENERGTPGALLLHMGQPALAKDTAGYEGGTSSAWYAENGIDPATQIVVDPLPAVQTLPATIPTTTTTATVQPTTTAAAPTNNFLPLALAVGLGVVAVAGEQLLHNRKKIVFAGGVAALFYVMSKRT